VLILAIILIGFSVILYQNLSRNLTDASEEDFAGIDFHHHFVQDTLANVANEIFLIDLVILVTSAGVSYVLAGYTLKPIQRSMEDQKKFSENASHELRTPLAVIKNDAEVLLRNPSPTKDLVQTMLRSTVEEIDRMSNMTRDLLALARSESHSALIMENVNVAEIAQGTAEKMRAIARGKSVTLMTPSDTAFFVEGNRAGLERVLMNLLQNAIEHTLVGGSITITTVQEESHVVITVTDTGSGIDSKDLPHIFERFYKGEGTSGSGLGLSIVKELVKQHSGTVTIESTKGKGTAVSVKLPRAT
jgi:signal transduction histidine kinase